MHFPKFWARGEERGVVCWRWSDASEADARQQAQAAAARNAAALERGTRLDRYGYGNRPMREPVLEEIRDDSGELAAVLTCNAYGATVLNAARALFVDIDLPETKAAPASTGGGFLASLFGRPSPKAADSASTAPTGLEALTLARVEKWTAAYPGWGWRIYRTRAGLRLLATHALFEPASPEVEALFEALGADPLYRQLCRAQRCFRARLTPKPWRCGAGGRPPVWPWRDEIEAGRFDRWHRDYSVATQRFATCRLLKTVGTSAIISALRDVVRLHDEHTRITTNLPLA
jgi:hypothetical protein